MCGFAGLFTSRPDRRAGIADAVARLIEPIRHRGPDAQGVWHDADAGIGLGFRRLAILDLTPAGSQPMESESARFMVTFNGEIFNHRALRAELAEHGHGFRGHSDTEVILAGFEQWGVRQTFPRLVGMFAMAVWDRERRELTLVRDRLGKKPLFVSRSRGLVLFGSELKALAADPDFDRTVDAQSVTEYLRHVYVPAPASIFKSTIKLPPAHFLVLRDAAAPLPEPEPYWDARAAARAGLAARITDPADAVEQVGTLFDDAVRLRLESDVPLGALLSGGIDSSLVVARMQSMSAKPVHTFTIGFDVPEWDESGHADAIARHLGTDHTLMRVTGDEALAVLPDLPTIFDEPLSDPSQVPTILVCRLARRDVTVALCGDGGDEVFGGYNRYVDGPRALNRTLSVPAPLRGVASRALMSVSADRWDALSAKLVPAGRRPRLLGEKLQKLALMLRADSPAAGYSSLLSAIQDPGRFIKGVRERPSVTSQILDGFTELTLPERMMLADQLDYLPDDLLAKVDRASMSTSLEVRAPLLDHRLVELAWRLDPSLKIRNGVTKWILRELLARDVPRELFERPKMGFSVPVRAWLTGPLRSWAEDLISDESLRDIPVLDAREVRRAWDDLLGGRAGNGVGMWTILQLIGWWRTWRPTGVEARGV